MRASFASRVVIVSMARSHAIGSFTLALMVALAPAVATAANFYWKDSVVTDNWSNGNNWSAVSAAGADNAGAPTLNGAVNIVNTDGTARTATYDVSAPAIGLLSIGLTGAGTTTNTLSMPGNNSLSASAIA